MTSALEKEIAQDPLGRGYASMTDQQVTDDLNTFVRAVPKNELSGETMWQQTVPAEFAALSSNNQQLWVSFTRGDGIDPFATANVQFVTLIFGAGSTTLSNLAAARTEQTVFF